MSNSLTFAERWQRLVGSVGSHLKRDRGFLARVEFWVYLPGEQLPSTESLMQRMMDDNPHRAGSSRVIGPQEGMLFSDVRTNISLIRKAKNAQIFRGGNFPGSVLASREQIERISDCESIAKVSFVSEQAIKGHTHVVFAVHTADSLADLGDGQLIYDMTGERLWDLPEWKKALSAAPKGDAAAMNLRTMWEVVAAGSRVETRGLRKLGVPELRTVEMNRDQQVVTEAVVGEAAAKIWQEGVFGSEVEVGSFGDTFLVKMAKRGAEFADVRILRVYGL